MDTIANLKSPGLQVLMFKENIFAISHTVLALSGALAGYSYRFFYARLCIDASLLIPLRYGTVNPSPSDYGVSLVT